MSHLARAWALYELRRYPEAADWARLAIADDPSGPEAHCLLAASLHGQDLPREALAAADEAAALGPMLDWPHRLRSLALLGLRRRRAALAAARVAVRLAPEAAEPHYVLAQAALATRRWRDAEAAAERCLRLAPHSSLGHDALALVLLRRRHWAEAEAACRRALAIDPLDAAAHHNLGLALSMQLGSGIAGVERLAEASRLDPSRSGSRVQAVAAARRHAGGVPVLVAVQGAVLVAVNWDEDAGVNVAMVASLLAIAAAFQARRSRRLRGLPRLVADHIRSQDARRRGRVVVIAISATAAVAIAAVVAGAL